MSKPNCYKCEYRGTVPGSCHSSCNHPKVKDNQLTSLMSGFLGIQMQGLEVIGSRHGRENGWFMWPMNFDPVWLESCDGFKTKEEVKIEG